MKPTASTPQSRTRGSSAAAAPAAEPPSPAAKPGAVKSPAKSASGDALPLPHERDESVSHVASAPDPVMQQAHKDIEAGMVDTDMRATPGLDAQRRDELVKRGGR